MNTLERYIGRAVLSGTLMTAIVILTLLGIFELTKHLDDIGVGTYTSWDAFIASLLTMPRKLFETFPVIALVGSLLGLGALANGGELTAMRAAGYSVNRLLLAVFKTGALMLIFVFLIGEFIAPASEEYIRAVKVEKQQQKITLKSKYGFWARDRQEFINIREVLPGSQLEDIYIYEVSDNQQLKLVTHAESAQYEDGQWQLENIKQTSVQKDLTKSRTVDSASWSSMIDPDLLSVIVVEPKMLPAWGLYQYMQFMYDNEQDASVYEVAFWRKVITPFTTLVMLLLAVPFVLGSLREVGVGQRIFIGTLIGTLFYAFNQSFSYIAVVYKLNPLIASLLPSLLMLLLGYYFIRQLNRI